LHEIALAQLDAGLAIDERIRTHAGAFTREDVQLFYQIGVLGRRDVPYAPDPRIGVEMTLLRMLAFRPADEAGAKVDASRSTTVSAARPVSKPAASAAAPSAPVATMRAPTSAVTAVASTTVESKPAAPTPVAATPVVPAPVIAPAAAIPTPVAAVPANPHENWSAFVAQLKLSGFVRELASNTTLESFSDGAMALTLHETCGQLLNKEREAELKHALETQIGQSLKFSIRVGRPTTETPAQERTRLQDEKQQSAVRAIQDDPNVRAMQDRFGAQINPTTIRPKV
jgi:DNA polymerase-3 subunit gamma/tau